MILKYIPNTLTIIRLLLIPPFLWLLSVQNYPCALYVFLIAGLTDALDGWLARHFNWKSVFGSFIDPLSDKLLITSSFIALACIEALPWWLVILVFLRDLSICSGVVFWHLTIPQRLIFNPTLLSKVNTCIQLLLVTVSLIQLAFTNIPTILIHILILLTAISTSSSYLDYTRIWGKKIFLTLQKK